MRHKGEVVTTLCRDVMMILFRHFGSFKSVFVCFGLVSFIFCYVSIANLCLVCMLEMSKRLEHIFSSCDLPSEVVIFCSSVGCFPSNCHLSCCFKTAGCPQLSSNHFENLVEAFNMVDCHFLPHGVACICLSAFSQMFDRLFDLGD